MAGVQLKWMGMASLAVILFIYCIVVKDNTRRSIILSMSLVKC